MTGMVGKPQYWYFVICLQIDLQIQGNHSEKQRQACREIGKLILKLIQKFKWPKIVKAIFLKRTNLENLNILIWRLVKIPEIRKWCTDLQRHADQWNRILIEEINSQHWAIFIMERKVFSKKMARDQIKAKLILDLNINIYKFSRGKYRRKIFATLTKIFQMQ